MANWTPQYKSLEDFFNSTPYSRTQAAIAAGQEYVDPFGAMTPGYQAMFDKGYTLSQRDPYVTWDDNAAVGNFQTDPSQDVLDPITGSLFYQPGGAWESKYDSGGPIGAMDLGMIIAALGSAGALATAGAGAGAAGGATAGTGAAGAGAAGFSPAAIGASEYASLVAAGYTPAEIATLNSGALAAGATGAMAGGAAGSSMAPGWAPSQAGTTFNTDMGLLPQLMEGQTGAQAGLTAKEMMDLGMSPWSAYAGSVPAPQIQGPTPEGLLSKSSNLTKLMPKSGNTGLLDSGGTGGDGSGDGGSIWSDTVTPFGFNPIQGPQFQAPGTFASPYAFGPELERRLALIRGAR